MQRHEAGGDEPVQAGLGAVAEGDAGFGAHVACAGVVGGAGGGGFGGVDLVKIALQRVAAPAGLQRQAERGGCVCHAGHAPAQLGVEADAA